MCSHACPCAVFLDGKRVFKSRQSEEAAEFGAAAFMSLCLFFVLFFGFCAYVACGRKYRVFMWPFVVCRCFNV